MGWAVKLAIGVGAVYGLAVGALWLAQGWLIFPSALAAAGPPLPDRAERLTITAADGTELVGAYLPPAGGGDGIDGGVDGGVGGGEAGDRPLVLGFGGNAWNADAVALTLAELYPEHPVVAFHYRGYGPSDGRSGAAPILADALAIHDAVHDRLGPVRTVVVGFSLGSGPAARLAAERPVAGTILVTPFDSLARLAAGHMPWAPVRALIRHRMPVVDDLSRSTAPVAVITAGRDTVVPAARSAPVADAAPDLAFREEIAEAGHNDLYADPAFDRAMRRAMAAVTGG